MRRVLAIGIGAGDLEHMTVGAIRALNQADVLFEIERGVEDLTALREEICRRYIEPDRRHRTVAVPEPRRDRAAPAYGAAVEDWRSQRAEVWERLIEQELDSEGCGAFLVWGDPSLYDSTIAVLDLVAARGRTRFELEVVPGISSIQALAARHRIPLNRVGGAVLVTTGRRLAEHGFPLLVPSRRRRGNPDLLGRLSWDRGRDPRLRAAGRGGCRDRGPAGASPRAQGLDHGLLPPAPSA